MEKSDLVDRTKPWGEITLLHSDGKEHTYYSCINDLTKTRLTGWNSDPPDIGEELPYVRSVFAGIHAKAKKVLKCVGTLCPVCNPKNKKVKEPEHERHTA